MDTNKILEALDSELAALTVRYKNAMENAIRTVKDYEGRSPSTHLGHNLANRATELSELAAKIEETKAVQAFIVREAEGAK